MQSEVLAGGYREPSVLAKSLPVIVPSLANKCGTIGMSLLPMLLVAHSVASGPSSVILAFVKLSALVGVFLGGHLSDRWRVKTVITSSFLIAGGGMLFLAGSSTALWLCVFGVIAQMGQSMFPSSAQLMLGRLLPPREQQEAVGWLRMANNFGQIVSYTLGLAFASLGVVGLMLFDAMTSFLAAGIGQRQLPSFSLAAQERTSVRTSEERPGQGQRMKGIVATVLMAATFSFFYDLFMTGAAAKIQLLHGAEGLRVFSKVMLINTVLCTGLSVAAARSLKNPAKVLPVGLLLAGGACLLLIQGRSEALFAGAVALTLGEICFQALSSFVLLRMTSQLKRRGGAFGAATLIQVAGRSLGGAAAFPIIVDGCHPLGIVLGALAFGLSMGAWAIPEWRRAGISS
jgi:MFS family permease